MVLINQKWHKILELLFEYPDKKLTIREISKKTRIPTSSVQRYLKQIARQGLVTRENSFLISSYSKFVKALFLIEKLFTCGLIDYLIKELKPSLIIVFGSARKGDYVHESDIDIFVESTKKVELDLTNFEKKLGHRIQPFVENSIKDLPPKLLNSVINGIKLYGHFSLK